GIEEVVQPEPCNRGLSRPAVQRVLLPPKTSVGLLVRWHTPLFSVSARPQNCTPTPVSSRSIRNRCGRPTESQPRNPLTYARLKSNCLHAPRYRGRRRKENDPCRGPHGMQKNSDSFDRRRCNST